MGTRYLHASQLAASLTAGLLILLISGASPTTSWGVEFGFLVDNYTLEPDDSLELTAETDDQGTEPQDGDLGNDADDWTDVDKIDSDGPQSDQERLVPAVIGGRFQLPPLMAKTIATEQIGNGKTPDNFRQDQPANQVALPEGGSDRAQPWNWSVVQWEAPNAFSYPLYFEDRMLERHGHIRFGHLQPVASGVRFFSTIPMLPYLMTIKSPCDPEYKLGHFRSGSAAPALLQRPPLERRAVVAESLFLGGAIGIFP